MNFRFVLRLAIFFVVHLVDHYRRPVAFGRAFSVFSVGQQYGTFPATLSL